MIILSKFFILKLNVNVDKLEKTIFQNKKNYIVKFIHNKRSYLINSSKRWICINIAIISYLFIKKFIKKIKLNIFFEESIIESRGKKVITNIGTKKIIFMTIVTMQIHFNKWTNTNI